MGFIAHGLGSIDRHDLRFEWLKTFESCESCIIRQGAYQGHGIGTR